MKEVSLVLCPRESTESFIRVFNQIVIRTRYDFSQVEIIVVDNNTDPEGRADIAQFVRENSDLCSMTYIENKDGGGVAEAVNAAIAVADSRWLVYIGSVDTYIYDPRWLQYMIGNMSEDDYDAGYRMAGTLIPGPTYPDSERDVYVQGSVFIAFTEYLKLNPLSLNEPSLGFDAITSARCQELGYQLKHLPRICSHLGDATQEWHDGNREIKRFLIAHVNGLSRYK